MKNKTLPCLLLLFLILPPYSARAERTQAAIAFDKLTSLIGTWQGVLPDGKPIKVTYQMISGGVILEMYHSEDPMWWNMSTVYLLDKEQILMTHYCSWGNHPRMRAPAGKFSNTLNTLEFNYLDITRTQAEKGYMRDLKLEFKGEDQLMHHWTWREQSQDAALTLPLRRKGALISRN